MSENGAETPIVLDLGGPRPKKKMGSACKSHGIQVPYRGGFVFRCYKQVCPWCRIEKAERERDEAEGALRLLASEVDAGRRDCQCGDLNCQHVAMTDGLLAAIYECCIAARAAGKGRGDE